jgi:hypothetical protein
MLLNQTTTWQAPPCFYDWSDVPMRMPPGWDVSAAVQALADRIDRECLAHVQQQMAARGW